MLALIHHLFEDCIGGRAIVLQGDKGCPCLHLGHVIQRFLLGITGLLNPSPHQHSTFDYLGDVEDDGNAILVKLSSDMLSFTGGVRMQLQEQHKAALIVASNDTPFSRPWMILPWEPSSSKPEKRCLCPFPSCMFCWKRIFLHAKFFWTGMLSWNPITPICNSASCKTSFTLLARLIILAIPTTCISPLCLCSFGQKFDRLHEGQNTLLRLAIPQPSHRNCRKPG